jgi:hypothetical protein
MADQLTERIKSESVMPLFVAGEYENCSENEEEWEFRRDSGISL